MNHRHQMNTARLTGFWYLLLAISGVLGFMVVHPRVFVADDPQATLQHLVEQSSMARIRLLLELAIVASQALAAVWFYKLFRPLVPWAAFAIGGWGLMNAAAIMVSAMAISTAIQVAGFSTPVLADKVLVIELLSRFMSGAWMVGGIFFGLWLLPMGYVVVCSRCMPGWLGRILMIGGIGYVVSTVFAALGMEHASLGLLTLPATIGEFWMIGYLLVYGIRPVQPTDAR